MTNRSRLPKVDAFSNLRERDSDIAAGSGQLVWVYAVLGVLV